MEMATDVVHTARPCSEDEARWEFRVWGELREERDRLEQVGGAGELEALDDHYLVGPRGSNPLKVRDGRLESKHLLERHHGFERWCPAWASDAPFPADDVGRALIDLGMEPDRARHVVDAAHPPLSEASLARIVREQQQLDWVAVGKRRRQLQVHGVRAELTEVSLEGGEAVWTVAIEGTDLSVLLELRDRLGLTEQENLPVHAMLARAPGTDDPTESGDRP